MHKIAIFSDIHGNLQALETIINDIKNNNFDEIICLGDIVAIGPNPKECLDIILNNDIKMVLGNHEMYITRGTHFEKKLTTSEIEHHLWVKTSLTQSQKEKLEKLDLNYDIKLGKTTFAFMHFPYNEATDNFYELQALKEYQIDVIFKNYNYDYIFYGHEHRSNTFISKDKQYIDVGSSGCTPDNKTFYTILDYDGENIKITKKELEYDRNLFEKTIINADYPEKELILKLFYKM